jgi:excisionase family DNA binding protein
MVEVIRRTICAMNTFDPTQLLSPADAAKILGVTPAAVIAIARRGSLPFLRTVGGRRLFVRSDVERLARERQATIATRLRSTLGS